MMLKRLSASFGRLKNETICLKSGLNIIEAPNESGKSTWCAFIKAMLYGIRTSDRDRQGYLSDKTRYRPWSGAPMEGAMDIETDNISLTIERKSDGKLPMRDFSAVHTGTAEPYERLYPDSAGETLLGVSEAVFERSAYISQAGIKISQTPELEKRISSLVTAGDESSSYTEADERLRLWLRKRRFNKSGTMPALEEKLAAIGRKLAHIESALDETASMRLEAERLKKRQSELSDALGAWDRFDAQLALRDAQDNCGRARDAYNALYRELSEKGPVPTESDLTAIRGDLKALEPLKTMVSVEQKHLAEARALYEKMCDARKATAFDKPDASDAVQRAVSLEQTIKKASFRSPSAALLISLTVIAALIALLAPAIVPQLPAARPVAAAAAVFFGLNLVWRIIQRHVCSKDLAEHLSKYGATSVRALQELYKGDVQLSAELAEAEREVQSCEKSVASAKSMHDTIFENLRSKLKAFSLDCAPEDIESVLGRAEALLKQLAAAKADIRAAESYLNTLKASVPGEFSGEAPERSRQEITEDLNQVTRRFEDLMSRYNMTLGEIRAVGDPVILGSEKKETEAELAVQKSQFDALSLAVETLREANNELQTRFSPLLSETAGRIIRRLTGGRYERLTFDKGLDASARTAGDTVSRNILSLSAGTADQIYLALRLAVCALVLPKDNPCPLILDDALTNFDDERAYLALDYLKELSRERQILLFTCHNREAAYFAGSNDVNIVRL